MGCGIYSVALDFRFLRNKFRTHNDVWLNVAVFCSRFFHNCSREIVANAVAFIVLMVITLLF